MQESEEYYMRFSSRRCAIRDINIIQPFSLRATPIKTPLSAVTIYPFILFYHFFLLPSPLPRLAAAIILALQSGSMVVMLSDRRCLNILAEIQIVRMQIYYYNKIIRASTTARQRLFGMAYFFYYYYYLKSLLRAGFAEMSTRRSGNLE